MALTGKKVLIVKDDEDLRALRPPHNRNDPPDVVVLDLALPSVAGFEVREGIAAKANVAACRECREGWIGQFETALYRQV